MDYRKFNSHCKYYIKVSTSSYIKTTFTFSANAYIKTNGKLKKAEYINPGDHIEFSRGDKNYSFTVNDVDFYNVCT